MMAKDASQRYPTPERAAQALQPFLSAGMEVVKAPALDARMSQYLIWLEKGANGAAPPPACRRRAAPPTACRHRPPPTSSRSRQAEAQETQAARGVPVTPTPPPAGMEFDVELVPVSTGPHDTRRLGRPKVHRQGHRLDQPSEPCC